MSIHPSAWHWYLFRLYQQYPAPLHPTLFLRQWDVSYQQLAQLAGCSLSTVEHWFSSGSSHRDPAVRFCRQLAIVDRLWSHSDRISEELIQLWCGSRN